MDNWNIVEHDGNPSESGVYDVVLIYDDVKRVQKDEYGLLGDLVPTGKRFAVRSNSYFGDALFVKGWAMKGQPDTGFVWSEECGSYPNEQVYAWLPLREYPDIELPEGIEWKDE